MPSNFHGDRGQQDRGKPRRHTSSRRDYRPPDQHHHRGPPKPLTRTDTTHSHYINMLLSQDEIPKWHTIAAAVCVWLLLAGFLVFPGTFTSLQKTIDDRDDDNVSKAGEAILGTVKNIPLLVIGAVACGISAVGMLALLIRHRINFVWLLNRLLIPGMANSLAGLISTLVGVYTQQHGSWSITAKITAIIEGVYLATCAALFGFFTYKLTKLKKRHQTFYDDGGSRRWKSSEERRMEQQKREEEKAALEPGGSIV